MVVADESAPTATGEHVGVFAREAENHTVVCRAHSVDQRQARVPAQYGHLLHNELGLQERAWGEEGGYGYYSLSI